MSVDTILERLERVRRSGGGWEARCPADTHGGDRRASLSVAATPDGRVLVKCHKGCEFNDIIRSVGLNASDLAPPKDEHNPHDLEWTPHGPAIAVYDYVTEDGHRLFQVLRTADKHFSQRRPDPSAKHGWRYNLEGIYRVPYRLPRVVKAVNEGRRVWIVEGEKDVQTLERLGETATCNPGGAGKWRDEYDWYFNGAHVVICADKDKPGQAHARDVARHLNGTATEISIVEPAAGKDITDHVDAGLGFDKLFSVTAPQDAPPDLAPDLHEFLAGDDEYHWVIPGLLERGDRLLVTGFEGLGKSVLNRQIAVCAAAGLHPFTFERLTPQRVLYIDCENSERLTRRRLRPLAERAAAAHRPVPVGGMRIIVRPEGLDLTRSDDADWLTERVTAHRPDILFIGPLYRLHAANMNEELPARLMVAAIDRARVQADCVIVIEAHAGHVMGEGKRRAVRPTGASIFMRWPEFGVGLSPPDGIPTDKDGRHKVADVVHWRGGRDDRGWPVRLAWGGPGRWPWMETKP